MLNKLSFFLRLIVAVILLQTLYFKFGGHAEAVHIFSTLGVEPWGRIGLGCVELFVALTLLIPKTQTGFFCKFGRLQWRHRHSFVYPCRDSGAVGRKLR